MAITKEQRTKVEHLVYKVMEKMDTSKTNVEYYKKLFAKMSDKELEAMFKRQLCLRFHDKPFVTQPKYADIKRAADRKSVV